MRAIAWFVAAIAGTLVLAALFAWPAWQLAQAIEPDWPFHKVVSRLWQLLMLAAFVVAVRQLGLARRADWGYGLPRSRFLRQFGAGLAIGLATMLPMAIAIVALGIRAPRADFGAVLLLQGIAAGAATGFAVALVEETFFRGLMHGAVARETGFRAALVSTALLYAALHFLTRTRIPAQDVGWDSGFVLLASSFARFAEPLSIADAFITLALVGALLALVRERTGAIAAGMGLHMGWVTVIKATAATTWPDPDSPWSGLVSGFDGFTGWMVAAWAALMLALAWRGGLAGLSRARA